MKIELESCRPLPPKCLHHEKHRCLDDDVQDRMLFSYYHQMHTSCIYIPILTSKECGLWFIKDVNLKNEMFRLKFNFSRNSFFEIMYVDLVTDVTSCKARDALV